MTGVVALTRGPIALVYPRVYPCSAALYLFLGGATDKSSATTSSSESSGSSDEEESTSASTSLQRKRKITSDGENLQKKRKANSNAMIELTFWDEKSTEVKVLIALDVYFPVFHL